MARSHFLLVTEGNEKFGNGIHCLEGELHVKLISKEVNSIVTCLTRI